MALVYLHTPLRRRLEIQFLTALSTLLIKVAGVLGLSPCLLPFRSFQIADNVAWKTYLNRNNRVALLVWSVRARMIVSHSFV
ncbi:hypothetical protein Bca52824_073765 [Brassica carinata]|uniref:Uncharacterized protein n=1 Tax=Brassica carinata TaxID=52824 RepID=A0A8X7U721_BRACI|nr:hypothetical protein Bca52824_073765 [Brassica carinata]